MKNSRNSYSFNKLLSILITQIIFSLKKFLFHFIKVNYQYIRYDTMALNYLLKKKKKKTNKLKKLLILLIS